MTDLAPPRPAPLSAPGVTRPGSSPARLARPRWTDARLLLGVLLVLVAVVVGARVFAAADTFTRVYVANHDLVPGEHLKAADLGVGRVRLDGQGSRYVAAGAVPPVGYVVTRYVGSGEFVPVASLRAGGPQPDSRFVTVPVQPGHLPPDLAHGDLVDVYLTGRAVAGGPTPVPVLVLGGVAVQSREGGSRGFSGSTTLAVVLAVPVERVADLVHAIQAGSIDLVELPASAAGQQRSAA